MQCHICGWHLEIVHFKWIFFSIYLLKWFLLKIQFVSMKCLPIPSPHIINIEIVAEIICTQNSRTLLTHNVGETESVSKMRDAQPSHEKNEDSKNPLCLAIKCALLDFFFFAALLSFSSFLVRLIHRSIPISIAKAAQPDFSIDYLYICKEISHSKLQRLIRSFHSICTKTRQSNTWHITSSVGCFFFMCRPERKKMNAFKYQQKKNTQNFFFAR